MGPLAYAMRREMLHCDMGTAALPEPVKNAVCREVLVMVMRKHQRYFPVVSHDSGDLLPSFVTVANGPVDVPLVRAGEHANAAAICWIQVCSKVCIPLQRAIDAPRRACLGFTAHYVTRCK